MIEGVHQGEGPERTDRAPGSRVGAGSVRWWLSLPFILLIRLYQLTLSPFMGGQCRFVPSCSHYAAEAYKQHGPFRGTWLTARRILRCHPFGGSGYDPVPLEKDKAGPRVARRGWRNAS
jgi:uncharacterized protein